MQALTVRLSGSFPREPHGASASCPGGNDSRPQRRLRTMIASPSRAAGMVATESRRNAHANRGQFRWNGERSPNHRKRSVTSHPDTAIASRPRAVRARMRPGSDPGPRLRLGEARLRLGEGCAGRTVKTSRIPDHRQDLDYRGRWSVLLKTLRCREWDLLQRSLAIDRLAVLFAKSIRLAMLRTRNPAPLHRPCAKPQSLSSAVLIAQAVDLSR